MSKYKVTYTIHLKIYPPVYSANVKNLGSHLKPPVIGCFISIIYYLLLSTYFRYNVNVINKIQRYNSLQFT